MTPTNAPLVRSHCRGWLKVLMGRDGAVNITSPSNMGEEEEHSAKGGTRLVRVRDQ